MQQEIMDFTTTEKGTPKAIEILKKNGIIYTSKTIETMWGGKGCTQFYFRRPSAWRYKLMTDLIDTI